MDGKKQGLHCWFYGWLCKKIGNPHCCNCNADIFLFQVKRLQDIVIKHLKVKTETMKTLQTLLLGLALAALTTGTVAQGSQQFNNEVLTAGRTSGNASVSTYLQNETEGNDTVQQNALTGMADVNSLAINRAYPGPVISEVHVDVSCAAETNATIKLIDIIGRTELERPVKLINGQNHFDISMDDMAGGVYQLIVQTDTRRVAYRLVKAK